MQGTEAPVVELAQEVPGTHTLRQVELALGIIIIVISYHHHHHHHHHCHLAVEAQNVLEYPRRPVEVELARGEAEGVAQGQNLRLTQGHG